MSTGRLVGVVLAALALALAVYYGYVAAARRGERRRAVEVEQGRRALLEVVRSGRASRQEEAVLRALPLRHQIGLFTELVPTIAGKGREQLSALARDVGLIPAAEEMARSRGWRDRLQGVRLLVAAGGGEAVVPRLLDDPHPAVRAEAVEWAGHHPTPEMAERLVTLLPRTDRYDASVVRDALLRTGADALAPLGRYLDRHNGRHALPALEVAAGMPDVRFAGAALRLCGDELPRVRAVAAGLAGAVGGEEAVAVLQGLLSDAEAEVRAAAASALGSLGHWPSAAAIALLLRDPAPAVRGQSALALRALGSPGLLYLRRALGDDDPAVVEAARQALEPPESSAEPSG